MSDLSYQRFETYEGDPKARFIVDVPELDDSLAPPHEGLLVEMSASHIGIHGEVAEGVDARSFVETAEHTFALADEQDGKRQPVSREIGNSKVGESQLRSTVYHPIALRKLLALIPGFEPAGNVNRPLNPTALEAQGHDLQDMDFIQFSRVIPLSFLRLTYERTRMVSERTGGNTGRIATQAGMGLSPEYVDEEGVHTFMAGMYAPGREDGPEVFRDLMFKLPQEAGI